MAFSGTCGGGLSAHGEEQNAATSGVDETTLLKSSACVENITCMGTEGLSDLAQETDLTCRDGVQETPEEDTECMDLGAIQELIGALSVAPGAGEKDFENATRSLMSTIFNTVRKDNVSLYKVILSCIGDMSVFDEFHVNILSTALSMESFKCARYLASIIQEVNMCDLLATSSYDSETFNILFNRGFKIENCPCLGMCCLRDCIVSKKDKMVKLCLENGCVANEPKHLPEISEAHPTRMILEYDDFTPLLCAVLYGNLETVKLLLEHHAKIITEEAYDMSPVEAAVYVTKPCMLEEILKVYRISVQSQGQSEKEAFKNEVQHAFNIAVSLKSIPLLLKSVDILMEFGASVNGVDAKGVLPIFTTIQNGFEHSLRLLLQRGSDVNAVGNVEKYGSLCQQVSPLQLATELPDDKMLDILLKAGAFDQSEDGLSEEAQKRITCCKKNFTLADWCRLSVRKQIKPFRGEISVKDLEIPSVLKQFVNMM